MISSIFSIIIFVFILIALIVGKQADKEDDIKKSQGLNPDFNKLKKHSSGSFTLDRCEKILNQKFYVLLVEETENKFITREYGGSHKIRRWIKETHYYFESLEQAIKEFDIVDGDLRHFLKSSSSKTKRAFIKKTLIIGGKYNGRAFPNFKESDYNF